MANKINKDLNNLLRNEVRNYNKKVSRAKNRGFRNLPRLEKVSEIKSRYNSEKDILREINHLKKFTVRDSFSKVENNAGAKATKWQFDYVKSNLKSAIQYFEQEYERVNKRAGKFAGERQYVNNIQSKLDLLNTNLQDMTDSQFRSAIATINEFTESASKRKRGYRGFLSEVDLVMDMLGISNEKQDKFFKKFEQLTPSQFLYAYDNNDIINRIYELADSPKYGNLKLNTTDEDAENLVNILLEEADDIVLDAKNNMD